MRNGFRIHVKRASSLRSALTETRQTYIRAHAHVISYDGAPVPKLDDQAAQKEEKKEGKKRCSAPAAYKSDDRRLQDVYPEEWTF